MKIFKDLFKQKIHKTAIIHKSVCLDYGVEIGAYSVIGGAAEIKGKEQKSVGHIYIGDGTVIREHVTIHSPTSKSGCTYIGESCYIQAHSHIGHDSQIGNNVTIACYACIGGHSQLESYVNMALHSVSHPRTRVGEGTIVGCNSFAKGELESWSVYVGNPAKRIKPNNYLREKLGLQLIP